MTKNKPDFWLIFFTFLLIGFGLVMVFSTSYYKGIIDPQINDAYFFFKKQFAFAVLGLILFFVFSNIRYTIYQKFVGPILLICVISLLLVYLPGIGVTIRGASRWLDLGLFSFQPSECVKLGLIIYTASIMVKKQSLLGSFRRSILPPVFIISLLCSILVLQPHYSATVIILATCMTMIFCAGAKIKHLFILASIGIPLLIGILFLGDYRIDRVVSHLNPLADPGDKGYQIIQSLLAIGPGGLTGVGLGNSIQKMAYLPDAHTDFIFAIIAEELGFLGASALVLCFIILTVRGVKIAVKAPDLFGMLLGIGIITLFATEAIFNLGVVTNLLPVTGVPLPLISYGGTALLIKMVELGILLNISRYQINKDMHKKKKVRQTVQI